MRFLGLTVVMSLLLCGLAARPVQAQEPSAPPPPEQSTAANDWLTREKLLGDWGGTRTELGTGASESASTSRSFLSGRLRETTTAGSTMEASSTSGSAAT